MFKKKQWSVLENEVGRKPGTQGSSYNSLSISLGKLPLHLCISAVPSLQQKCFIRWHPVTVFILFHQLLFCFKRFDEVVDIQIEEILSWSLFSLILLPANCCLEPPSSSQPTIFYRARMKGLFCSTWICDFPSLPSISSTLERQGLCFYPCGNSSYPFFRVNFILIVTNSPMFPWKMFKIHRVAYEGQT